MIKHTRGEWKVTNSGGSVQIGGVGHPKTICVLEAAPLKISPEVEANARLIAQAPAMYEALKEADKLLNLIANKLGGITQGTDMDTRETRLQIQSILDKIEE